MLGPSGSGKTTCLRMIAGFERPDQGRVRLAGEDVTDIPPNERDVNTVFQDYALFPHMSVGQNVGVRPARQEGRRGGAQAARPGGARDGAAGRLRRPPPGPALRRPAPARRACPGARQPASRAAARRAARRARPEAAPAAPGRAEADPAGGRDHLHLRHPRPGRGAHDERPDRRHGRRPRPPDRRAATRSTTTRARSSSPASSASRTCSSSRSSRVESGRATLRLGPQDDDHGDRRRRRAAGQPRRSSPFAPSESRSEECPSGARRRTATRRERSGRACTPDRQHASSSSWTEAAS